MYRAIPAGWIQVDRVRKVAGRETWCSTIMQLTLYLDSSAEWYENEEESGRAIRGVFQAPACNCTFIRNQPRCLRLQTL